MAQTQSHERIDYAQAPAGTVEEKAAGISPKAVRTTLLVVLGIQSALAAAIGALAFANGETEVGVIVAAALVLYLPGLVGVARDAKWGYWVTLIIGVLSVVGSFSGPSGSVGVGIGALLATFAAIRLFHPAHR